jgi:hypothetical protein
MAAAIRVAAANQGFRSSAALDPFETTIEIVEPTCEADIILVQPRISGWR